MRPCSRTDHARAQQRVRELGYPPGCDKWKAFWDGVLARIHGRTEADCPIPACTPKEVAAGKRAPHRRGAWLEGFMAERRHQPDRRRNAC